MRNASLIPSFAAQYTLAQLQDTDAIKVLIATSLTAQTYTGAALDGALANPGPAVMRLPQRVTVTTTVDAATYNTTNPIVVTGTNDDGDTVTNNLLLTQAGGGETITGTVGFATVTSIAVPAQLTVNGEFTFGVTDVFLPGRRGGVGFRFGTAANIVVEFDGSRIDTFAGILGETVICLHRGIRFTNTTANPVTIYRA